MAFEKIVAISVESQWYRRCGQLATLEAQSFPVVTDEDFYHVIWAKPFEEYGEEALIQSLVEMGFAHWEKVSEITETHLIRYYDLSLIEAQIRALQYCLEMDCPILMVADDVSFKKNYYEMSQAFNSLLKFTNTTAYPVGICQLDYGNDPEGKYANARKHVIVFPGAKSKFLRGVMGQSTSAIFVTPYGAEQVLTFLKSPECPIKGLEVMPPRYWYNKPWMYTVAERDWVHYLRSTNGWSIASKIDEHEQMSFGRVDGIHRRDRSYRLLEKNRIPFQQ